MNNRDQRSAAQTLMQEMQLDEGDLERRKKAVALEAADLPRIAAIKDLVVQGADDYTATFFDHLGRLEEGRSFTASRALVDKARQLKRDHLLAMVSGQYGLSYVEQRLELAALYANAGLQPRAFLGAFHQLITRIGADVMRRYERSPLEGFENFAALRKVAFFDIGIIVDVLVFERERIIRHQHEAIRELSTPVLQIRDRLLLIPIIGVIDTHRARLVTEGLLRAIRSNRAKAVVMDVTGVATIDSKVANHLLQTVTAARLMGAHVIVTGLSSEVAQSLVALGIELAKVNTVGDLQGGLEEAEQIVGHRPRRATRAARADARTGA
jgi:rsbT co-antagonist protein RsbR